MKVDEKCDVYSFGVLTLEVMMGKHPGDFISSLMLSASTSSSSPIGHNTVLKDVLDQRLPPPENELADGMAHVAKLAFAYNSMASIAKAILPDGIGRYNGSQKCYWLNFYSILGRL